MSYKEKFLKLCEDIELELLYRLGILEEELRAIEEYYKVKHDYLSSYSYKHGLNRLEEMKKKLMEVVR